MKISDEKRREVAENLRNLTIGRFIQYKEQFFDELAEVVVGFEDYHDFNVVLEKLADLIDCPAIKPEPSGRAYWRCPRCGAFNYRSAVTDCCGVIRAHYCANCGAEVVE